MPEHESLRPLSTAQREAWERATARYEESIVDAMEYLQGDRRGLAVATALTFRLGVVVDPFPGHQRFESWIAIPYLGVGFADTDRETHPVSMRFHCPVDHDHRDYGHGKYMSLPGEPARVFNIPAIHQAVTGSAGEIHVAEGEFDAMILTQIGLPAVAIPGAQGWKSHHHRMLAGFRRVFVWGDPDDAGSDFITRVCRSMRQARGVQLHVGDVTRTYVTGGADALLDCLKEAM